MLLGLDIGGANLKASDGERRSVSRPFAIWQAPDRLADELQQLLSLWDGYRGLAVTMTAELADCFATKADGIDQILRAVECVAAGRSVQVWQTGGEFVSTDEARELPRLVAAANWHALATWAGRMLGGAAGLLMDIGSTTTDIIPIAGGLPLSAGATDVDRLLSGELVYLGIRRTPLCAVSPTVTFSGRRCPLAAELFATTYDLFLLTGELPADPNCRNTADGRPAIRSAAYSRLAHMLCCDVTELTEPDAVSIARELREAMLTRLSAAVQEVLAVLPSPCQGVLTSGEGEFLATVLRNRIPALRELSAVSLTSALGPTHSSAACAFAVARLARERGE